MKLIVLTFLAPLFVGCASNPLVTMNPYRAANYPVTLSHPSTTVTAKPSTVLPTGVIVTNSGNYVVIPNYSTGGVSAVIGPR